MGEYVYLVRPIKGVTKLYVPNGIETVKYEYPSQWFIDHPNQKPFVNVVQTQTTDEDLARMINVMIQEKMLQFDLIVEFMTRMMAKITDVLDLEWRSFGILIGEEGSHVTPLSLIATVVQPGVHNADIQGPRLTDSETWGCFWGLVSMYQIMTVSTHKSSHYVSKVISSVEKVFKIAPYNVQVQRFTAAATVNHNSTSASDYTVLIASLDMFFHRFPEHKFASSRIGTLASRDKSCAALTGLNNVSEVVGLKPSEIILYITNKVVANEIRRILKEDEELDNSQSYARYIIDMRLSFKSPYSATANPAFHLWIHTIGTVFGSSRSINASMIGDVMTFVIQNSGLVTGSALKNKSGKRSPHEVCRILQENDGGLPAETRTMLAQELVELRNARPGTVGHSLRNKLGI